jgi:hypothetical protein
MVRKGNIIERHFAFENGPWREYGDIEFAEPGEESYVGMFCVSHNAGRLARTEHREIKLIKTGD